MLANFFGLKNKKVETPTVDLESNDIYKRISDVPVKVIENREVISNINELDFLNALIEDACKMAKNDISIMTKLESVSYLSIEKVNEITIDKIEYILDILSDEYIGIIKNFMSPKGIVKYLLNIIFNATVNEANEFNKKTASNNRDASATAVINDKKKNML